MPRFLQKIFRLTPEQERGLKKLAIETDADLLYHFPSRYVSSSAVLGEELAAGENVTVVGRVVSQKARKAWRSKVPMADMVIEDANGKKIKATWFHQAYMAKKVLPGTTISLTGKVTERNGTFSIINPVLNEGVTPTPTGPLFKNPETRGELTPVYPETRHLSSLWFQSHVDRVLKDGVLDEVADPIPAPILKKYNLPTLKTALVWIHTPKNEKDAAAARKRFAFEEIFFIQLARLQARESYRSNDSFQIETSDKDIAEFLDRFPFDATNAQKKAIRSITEDFRKKEPMTRLLEGDVGSGKTAVAATTAYSIVTSRPAGQKYGNLQVAYMAPTEILARQHFESFIEYFRHLPIQIGLITGTECRKFPSKIDPSGHTHISRAQLLKWVANGEVPILIGTHALIQKSVKFKHLAYTIVDEQHRFGIGQRGALTRGKNAEHTRNDAEKLLYENLTYKIRGAVFAVKKELGGGHSELIYQRALAEELKKAGLLFNREVKIPVSYNKKEIGIYQPDFVVEDKVIIELKSLQFLGDQPKKQLWKYLKGSEYRLALLVNFGNEVKIERVVYDQARSASLPQSSALVPHYLSMTATPIPRTLALTIFGDLDLTLLDEMPAGRKPIKTEIATPKSRKAVYEHIREELQSGRQAYVICPRIDEPDPTKELALQAKSAKSEAERLQKEVFPEFRIGLVHSKLKPADKETVMRRFANHGIDILVATSVVEVGVNVPNATIILIEGAERFGLSQLHQLRGRVLRSTHQAHCYLFTETKSEISLNRLKALVTAKNGFELAELDLKLRGPGELSGAKQWGISDLGMEAIKNLKMVEAARTEARAILEKDPELKTHPLIRERVTSQTEQVHLE